MIDRRTVLAAMAAGVALPAGAHHGWRWTDGGQFELTGIIRQVRLGNPHGLLGIEANGEMWTAEVGQPWRNERAGLSTVDFEEGREITLLGERSANADENLMKAEVIVLDGERHVLYPDRV